MALNSLDFYNSAKNELNSFRQNLEKKIKNKSISLENNECYLIEETWEKDIIKKILQIENNLKSNNNKKDQELYNSSQENNPIFYNDISSAINGIIKGNKFKLIDKKLIELFLDKNALIDNNTVNYFTGNNLLIIEYKGKYENNSMLLINPLKDNNKNKNLLIISFKIKENGKILLYNKLLSKEINLNLDLKKKLENNNIVINFEKILDNKNISSFFEIFNENTDKNVNGDILKILIHFYYFEKSLSKFEPNNNFCPKDNYCLINPSWLKKFKNFYNCLKIYDLLNIYDKVNKDIYYNNLNEKIEFIAEFLLNKLVNFNKSKFPDKLIDITIINPTILTKNNIVFYDKCFIFPINIIEMLKRYVFKNKTILIKPKKIFAINKYIILIDGYTISVGNLNNKLIFIPKYIFFYKNKKILESEKFLFDSYSFAKYIKLRKCKENIYENQILRNEEDEQIGELIILNEEKLTNISSQYSYNYLNKYQNYSKKKTNNGLLFTKKKKNTNISLDKIKSINYENNLYNKKKKLKNKTNSRTKFFYL